MIYADNAATTKMSGAAINTMTACMQDTQGNPSSLYSLGQRAKETLEDARERIAACIGASSKEITFTSGGSEADNQAIRAAVKDYYDRQGIAYDPKDFPDCGSCEGCHV